MQPYKRPVGIFNQKLSFNIPSILFRYIKNEEKLQRKSLMLFNSGIQIKLAGVCKNIRQSELGRLQQRCGPIHRQCIEYSNQTKETKSSLPFLVLFPIYFIANPNCGMSRRPKSSARSKLYQI